jgi:hypothetical protein
VKYGLSEYAGEETEKLPALAAMPFQESHGPKMSEKSPGAFAASG